MRAVPGDVLARGGVDAPVRGAIALARGGLEALVRKGVAVAEDRAGALG
jgi:hypothetical protein